MAPSLSWSVLPQDLTLPLVIAGGHTFPNDCARYRALCRWWCLVSSPRRLPWIVLPDGLVICSEEGSSPRVVPFIGNQRCIGTTDSWLAIDSAVDAQTCAHSSYSLHNLFSNTIVPLPELDRIIGNVSKPFEVRKVLMKSPPTGLVAVRTNSYDYPIILLQPGKGAWLPPKPQTALLSRIIDVAFLEDKLYGITQAEDLISLCITSDSDGLPTVTNIEHVVNHTVGDHQQVLEESRNSTTGYIIDDGMRRDDEESSSEHVVLTIWYLVESCGKLLMVRRQLRLLQRLTYLSCKVEVFEADTCKKAWVPLSGGLNGQALFISRRFSKSLFAFGEVKEDSIYFIDTGEVFSVIFKTTTPPTVTTHSLASCLFLPDSIQVPIRY